MRADYEHKSARGALQQDIYRGALRIVAHFVRHLAPHANTLEEWRQSRKTVADDGEAEAAVAAAPAAPAPKGGGAAANAVLSNFGNSASALLHVDLLPLLRQEGKGDEGGAPRRKPVAALSREGRP